MPEKPIFIDETPPPSPNPSHQGRGTSSPSMGEDKGGGAQSTSSATPAPKPEGKEKKKNKKPKKEKKLDALKNIFETDGEMPDMTKMDRVRRRPRTLIFGLIAFFAVLAAAAWAGFFIFKPYGRFEGNGVKLSIDGPAEIKAGEPTEFQFVYKNTERVGLASLELRLVIPKEFKILETSTPPTTDPLTWTLGSLGAGDSGSLRVRGLFLGPAESQTAFQSIATYRPSNFNSDFQAITTRQITLKGSVLEGTLVGPNEIAPGEEMEWSYKLKNTGSEPLETLEIVLEKPAVFIFASSEPASKDEREGRWEIAKLDPGAEIEIKVKGSFSSEAKGLTELAMSTGIRLNDERLVNRRDPFSTDVLASQLELTLIANGSTNNQSINLGGSMNLTLSYKNSGTLTLGNVTLSITTASDPSGLIDWPKLGSDTSGRVADGSVTWTKKELPSLAEVAGGAEGSIDLTLPLVTSAPGTRGADEIRLSGAALISTVGGRVAARQIQTTPIIMSINSNLGFSAEARYFDEEGAPMGSGPLPPKVGATTNLRVVWRISNTLHELENLKVKTVLPARVSWTGRVRTDLGTLSWDESSRTVTLSLDKLPTNIGSLAADFEVGFTPQATDVGKFITLTGDTTLSARDSKTGTALTRSVGQLTSEMPTDSEAGGRGVVVE